MLLLAIVFSLQSTKLFLLSSCFFALSTSRRGWSQKKIYVLSYFYFCLLLLLWLLLVPSSGFSSLSSHLSSSQHLTLTNMHLMYNTPHHVYCIRLPLRSLMFWQNIRVGRTLMSPPSFYQKKMSKITRSATRMPPTKTKSFDSRLFKRAYYI
jgi:hypothetical protein